VLVLSMLAGAARELTSALLVNPYDVTGVAEALQSALWMPLPQRRERYQAMIDVIRSNDIHVWNRRFLEALQAPQGGLPNSAASATARPGGISRSLARSPFKPVAMQHPER
jgi:trehalose 6-phosphate synthase